MKLRRLNESNNTRHLSEKEWEQFDEIVEKFAKAYAAISDFSSAIVKARFLKDQKDTFNNNIYEELADLTANETEWDLASESLSHYSYDERGIDITDKLLPKR